MGSEVCMSHAESSRMVAGWQLSHTQFASETQKYLRSDFLRLAALRGLTCPENRSSHKIHACDQ